MLTTQLVTLSPNFFACSSCHLEGSWGSGREERSVKETVEAAANKISEAGTCLRYKLSKFGLVCAGCVFVLMNKATNCNLNINFPSTRMFAKNNAKYIEARQQNIYHSC